MVAAGLTVLVAVLHIGFMVLESVLWTKPTGRKIFGLSRERAEMTKDLASNQGVYNGVLGAGLLWSLYAANPGAQAFLLVFVVVVGIYGAITVKPTIFFVQALPALLGLGAMAAAL